jgi:organic hydroperoxide reductase OsmC/OhrA
MTLQANLRLVTPTNVKDHFTINIVEIILPDKGNMMKGKLDKQFLFEVNLHWNKSNKGILSAQGIQESIHVSTPAQLGGEGKLWTPEYLFLSSINSGFMTTCLAYADKMALAVAHFECSILGQIEIIEGRYKFTNINLYPKLFIAEEALRKKAAIVLNKTHKYCMITNSINAIVFYHSEVLIS